MFRTLGLILLALTAGGCASGAKDLQGLPENVSPESFRSCEGLAGDVRELMLDLAKSNVCGRLKGHFFTLSSEGAGQGSNGGMATGNLWINSCSARESEQKLTVEISGQGWRWVSQEQSRFGADFAVNENIRFSLDLTLTGAFDMAYDPGGKTVTFWLVPTQPIEMTFTLPGDVIVHAETLWASVVGQLGSIIGKSPETMARESIRQKGKRDIRGRLAQGITVIFDLCSGNRYIKFGQFPGGEVPSGKEIKCLADNEARLGRDSLVISGPFAANNPIDGKLRIIAGGGVRAAVVSQDNAAKIADAYANGLPLPPFEPLKEIVVSSGSEGFTIEKSGEQVALVLRPLEDQGAPVTCAYRLCRQGQPESLVECDR